MIKNRKIICIVKGCSSTGLLYDDKFHKVKKRWLPRIGRMDLDSLSETEMYSQHHRVCNLHFSESSYTSTLKTGLLSEAEPELFIPDPEDADGSGGLKMINVTVPCTSQDETGEGSSAQYVEPEKTADPPMVVKDENEAELPVTTVYSGSEDETGARDGENTEDSNDLENMSLEKRIANNSTHSRAVDPLLLEEDSETSKTQSSDIQTSTNEIPSYMRISDSSLSYTENLNIEELREELYKKIQLIKTLEKCLIEKKYYIQKLAVENLELKRQIKEKNKI